MAVQSAPTEFTLFSSLPRELRVKIWKLHSHCPRKVHVTMIPFDGKSCFVTFETASQTPAVLHTSQESRAQALKFYSACLKSDGDPTPRIYVNPAVDKLFIKFWLAMPIRAIERLHRCFTIVSEDVNDLMPIVRYGVSEQNSMSIGGDIPDLWKSHGVKIGMIAYRDRSSWRELSRATIPMTRAGDSRPFTRSILVVKAADKDEITTLNKDLGCVEFPINNSGLDMVLNYEDLVRWESVWKTWREKLEWMESNGTLVPVDGCGTVQDR